MSADRPPLNMETERHAVDDGLRKHAEQAARETARRHQTTVCVVTARGPRRFDIITGEEPPPGRSLVSAWRPDGTATPAWDPVNGAAPRPCRKTFDIYDRTRPDAGPVCQIKAQTRGEAHSLAVRDSGINPGSIMTAIAGPGSADEITRTLAREEKQRLEHQAKNARPWKRDKKERERTAYQEALNQAEKDAQAEAPDDDHQAEAPEPAEAPAPQWESAQAHPIPEPAEEPAEEPAPEPTPAPAPAPRTPKEPRPYAFDMLARLHDGTETRIARVASTAAAAEKSAKRNPTIIAVSDLQPMTEAGYTNTYGTRRVK